MSTPANVTPIKRAEKVDEPLAPVTLRKHSILLRSKSSFDRSEPCNSAPLSSS